MRPPSFALALLVMALMCVCGNSCHAVLTITMQEVAQDKVQISWSGSGTIGPSATLETQDVLSFNNLEGPFGKGISDSDNPPIFSLSSPLTLMGVDYTNNYVSIRPFRQSSDDLDLLSGPNFLADGGKKSLRDGDSYNATGSAMVVGLNFSDLVPGSYATTSIGDAPIFGGVTLNIVATAIPEPSAFLFGGLVCGGLAVNQWRKRNLARGKWHFGG